MLSEFGTVLIFIIGGLGFVATTLLVGYLLRPRRPNPEKLKVYECGEKAEGEAWAQFNIRFYVIALIFLLFDIEIVFIFPLIVVFTHPELIELTGGQWVWFAFVEMIVFIAILSLGLAYVWRKGHLDWVKPAPEDIDVYSPIPESAYARYLN